MCVGCMSHKIIVCSGLPCFQHISSLSYLTLLDIGLVFIVLEWLWAILWPKYRCLPTLSIKTAVKYVPSSAEFPALDRWSFSQPGKCLFGGRWWFLAKTHCGEPNLGLPVPREEAIGLCNGSPAEYRGKLSMCRTANETPQRLPAAENGCHHPRLYRHR